jgi:pyrimidine deaminase RibD-like protein
MSMAMPGVRACAGTFRGGCGCGDGIASTSGTSSRNVLINPSSNKSMTRAFTTTPVRRSTVVATATDDGDKTPSPSPSSEITDVDRGYMRRALELAARATGDVYPNPLVGCVVVDADRDVVVGEGYHPKAGEPHAEVFALRAAGDLARGATAYVTLEPCNHFGRTPPCARALVDAGVARVVVGFVDPDPRVSGGGIQTLLNAGIQVVVGCEESACREINAEFIDRQLKLRNGE